MTFDELLRLWTAQGLAGLRDAFEGPLLLPLEPWLRPATGRLTLALSQPEEPSSAEGFSDVATVSGVSVLRVVRSTVGDRVPAERVAVLAAAKTARNAYAHVAVGRSAQNDVIIDHASVSRFHADIRWSESGYAVRDARSRNGTRVNGTLLRTAHGEPLRPGDVVAFGDAGCLFCPLEEEPLARVLSRLSAGKGGKGRGG
ncbi:MAG: FHA domain-containing protein [Myxococcales bacterium]